MIKTIKNIRISTSGKSYVFQFEETGGNYYTKKENLSKYSESNISKLNGQKMNFEWGDCLLLKNNWARIDKFSLPNEKTQKNIERINPKTLLNYKYKEEILGNSKWNEYINYIREQAEYKPSSYNFKDIGDAILANNYIIKKDFFGGLRDSGYFHFYLESISNKKYIINSKITNTPYTIIKNATLLHRYDELSQKVSGFRMGSSNISKEFEIWNTHQNLKISDKPVKDNIQNIWEEWNNNEEKDIFDTIDKQQKEIVKDVSEPINGSIFGFAGTGKTVVGYELAAKLSSKDRTSCFISPNTLLKNASDEFFMKIGAEDIKSETYENLNNEFKVKVAEYYSKSVSLPCKKYKNINGIRVPEIINSILINNPQIINSINDGHIDELALSVFVIKNNLHSLFMENFNISILKLIKILGKQEIKSILNNEYMEDVFENIEVLKRMQLLNVEQIFLDEAPMISEYPLLTKYLQVLNKNVVKIYDKLQHSKRNINILNDEFHEDEFEWTIKTVYRTTKEIFEGVLHIKNLEYEAPISLKGSFNISKELNGKYPIIRLSDLINSSSEWIGKEFIGVNLILDIPIKENNKHLLYMAGTRARKYLNIIDEVKYYD